MNVLKSPYVKIIAGLTGATLVGTILAGYFGGNDAPDTIVPGGHQPDRSACTFRPIYSESDIRRGQITLGRVVLHVDGTLKKVLYDFNADDVNGGAVVPKDREKPAYHSYPIFPGQQDTYPIEVHVKLAGEPGSLLCGPEATFTVNDGGIGKYQHG